MPTKETYNDIDKAFLTALKPLKLDKSIRVDSIRRLQKSRPTLTGLPSLESSWAPTAVRNSGTICLRSGASYEPSFHNDIPQYALGSHRHLGKIAVFMRERDRDLRTRISIQRGDVWPSITVREPSRVF